MVFSFACQFSICVDRTEVGSVTKTFPVALVDRGDGDSSLETKLNGGF